MGFTIVLIINRPVPEDGGLLKFLRLSSPLTRRRVGGDGAKVWFCERLTAEGLKEELLYV